MNDKSNGIVDLDKIHQGGLAKMSEVNKGITKIQIYADYASAYAWDQEGCCIGLAENFIDNIDIRNVEGDLIKWSSELWDAENDDINFPWDDFHRRGLALTERLNLAIPIDRDVEISYQRPFEDPKSKLDKEVIYFRKRKCDK